MGRRLLGVLAGLAVAMVTIVVVEMVGMQVYPLPEGVNPQDPASLAAAIPQMPLGAFLFVLLAWLLGASCGALVAGRVAREHGRRAGLTVGALVLVGALYNLYTIPHPVWFAILAVVGIAAVTHLAARNHAVAQAG